jgi:outer membrane protein OmpA-like peptidoglycan-associated protein
MMDEEMKNIFRTYWKRVQKRCFTSGKNHMQIAVYLLLTLLITENLFSQNTPKESFFADYKKQMMQLRQNNGEIFSPKFYQKAVEAFKEANELYDDNESVVDIREKLQETEKWFVKAQKTIDLVKDTLKESIIAREAALAAGAPLFAAKEWGKAEEYFNDAIQNIEEEDIDDAFDLGKDAVIFYKQAQLLALKNHILSEAKKDLENAQKLNAHQLAPQTFAKAGNFILQAEQFLEMNRDAVEQAQKIALKASDEALHAQYLAKTIKTLSADKRNWEALLLQFEKILTDILLKFNQTAVFDEGFESAVKNIAAHIQNLKLEKDRLVKENSELEEKLYRIQEREASVNVELELKKEKERKINKIITMYKPEEAKVIWEGDKLAIRLTGLRFSSSKAIIEPEFFSLLTKVERSIREFSDSYILIEGHTDSRGNPAKNKMLSEKRAMSVKKYLKANMELSSEQIDHYGLGDKKPIAPNNTKYGREKNRRIEVIIYMNN